MVISMSDQIVVSFQCCAAYCHHSLHDQKAHKIKFTIHYLTPTQTLHMDSMQPTMFDMHFMGHDMPALGLQRVILASFATDRHKIYLQVLRKTVVVLQAL